MDFQSLAAAHLPPARRSKSDPVSEDRYYRSCPDLSSLMPHAVGRIAVVAGALVTLFVMLGAA